MATIFKLVEESNLTDTKNDMIEEHSSPYPTYKRVGFFNEWISQFRDRPIEIPDEVYDKIKKELHKNEKITSIKIRLVLKKLSLTQYYEHTPYIVNKLSGLPFPIINESTENELKKMFQQIQEPFERHKQPPNRISFIGYSYVMRKFCELLELDNFICRFPLSKSRQKLRLYDKIWKGICSDLGWQYIPSI